MTMKTQRKNCKKPEERKTFLDLDDVMEELDERYEELKRESSEKKKQWSDDESSVEVEEKVVTTLKIKNSEKQYKTMWKDPNNPNIAYMMVHGPPQ